MTKLKLHTTISLPDTRNVYDKSLNDEEYPEAEHWMEDCTLQFLEFMIRTNDYCKDKDKEVNAASVVNVSEQETHGSQECIVEAVNENENQQSGAAKQKNKS